MRPSQTQKSLSAHQDDGARSGSQYRVVLNTACERHFTAAEHHLRRRHRNEGSILHLLCGLALLFNPPRNEIGHQTVKQLKLIL